MCVKFIHKQNHMKLILTDWNWSSVSYWPNILWGNEEELPITYQASYILRNKPIMMNNISLGDQVEIGEFVCNECTEGKPILSFFTSY